MNPEKGAQEEKVTTEPVERYTLPDGTVVSKEQYIKHNQEVRDRSAK